MDSAPPSEGAGNTNSHAIGNQVITHKPVPDWVKATLRPLNLHTPCSVPFPHISIPHQVLAGRLRLFVDNWKKLTQDLWVLNTIQGYKIPFSMDPYQKGIPESVVSKEEDVYISQEIQSLLDKGAVIPAPYHPGNFFSTVFTVPKRGGERRPIINLKCLNRFVPHVHFKMEGIQSLRDIIPPGDFMIKIDLKDAYFSIPIHPPHQKFLSFRWKHKTFQFTCLPFGLSSAPRTFTKVMKPVIAYLRSLGIRMVVYLDDMLILAQTKEELLRWRSIVLDLLENLGFLINYVKSELEPTQSLVFLGFLINTVCMQIKLPKDKVSQAIQEAQNLLQSQQASARQLAHLIGVFSSTLPAILPAPLNYRGLQLLKHQALKKGGYDVILPLTQEAKDDLDSESESGKRATSGERPTVPPDTVRCITDGLGGSMRGGADRWPLDSRREITAHKLPGAIGSHICSSSLCQRQTEFGNPHRNGQLHSSGICQSYGGNKVTKAVLLDKGSLELVPSATPVRSCIPHSREAECRSGLPVEVNCGPPRLEAGYNSISSNQFSLGPPRDRLVCVQDYQTAATVLQLEARPTSRGGGCIQAGVDRVHGLCKPSMGPDRSLCSIHPSAGCNDSTNHSIMARSAMVPDSVPSITGQSKVASFVPRPSNQPSGSQDSSPRESQSTGRMVHLRKSYQGAGISEEASSLLLASWRSSTTKNYNSSWRVWEQWCIQSGANPISPTLSDILNFLAYQFHQGKQYRSLNCYRSALSSVLAPIDGFDIGRHPLVCRILKGVFQLRPPKAKYTAFWSVEQILNHLASWGDNQSLPLQKLTWKLAMLLALCSASRTSDLTKLSVRHRIFSRDKVTFYPTGLAKQSSADRLPTPIEFQSFSDHLLCPVECLQRYEAVTTSFRMKSCQEQLFLSINKPHSPVVSSSIARWLKLVLTSAGIDTSIFSAHSTRGASTSAASLAGVTTQQILSTADWSTAKVFKTFYFRDGQVQSPRHGFDLSVLSASKSRCDKEPEPSEVQSLNG